MDQLGIVDVTCKELREMGRESLKGQWKTAILAVILFMAICELPTLLLSPFKLSYVGMLLSLIVIGAITFGVSWIFLNAVREEKIQVKGLFYAFQPISMLFKTLGLALFQLLFISLWSMLFVVPGIIAAIRYSQAFFIMADDNTKGIRQCVNESKEIMQGNKMKYFLVNLSFIGWQLLAAVVLSVLVGGIFGFIYMQLFALTTSESMLILYVNLVSVIMTVVSIVIIAPITAYIYVTKAAFYDYLIDDGE